MPLADSRLSLTFTKKKKSVTVPQLFAPYIDTHGHITSLFNNSPAEIIARAALAGCRGLITLVDTVDDAVAAADFPAYLRNALAGARKLLVDAEAPADTLTLLDNVRFLAGAHPYGAPRYTDSAHGQLLDLLDDPLCVGVGEIGLDYHIDVVDDVEPAPRDVQIACMERQLEVAVTRNLPVELHLRHADDDIDRMSHNDAYESLRRVGVPAAGCVLHCFGEDRQTMERFVGLGCFIAYGGAATFKRNAEIRKAFAATPLDRILFETDCPYMAPEPIRGLECEPAMAAITINTLVNDRVDRTGEDAETIERAAWENSCRLFGF